MFKTKFLLGLFSVMTLGGVNQAYIQIQENNIGENRKTITGNKMFLKAKYHNCIPANKPGYRSKKDCTEIPVYSQPKLKPDAVNLTTLSATKAHSSIISHSPQQAALKLKNHYLQTLIENIVMCLWAELKSPHRYKDCMARRLLNSFLR